MKFISILFLFFLTSFLNVLLAQDVELKWGLPVKANESVPTTVLGKDETGFYIIKHHYYPDLIKQKYHSVVYLEKFDTSMNFLWTKKIEIYLTEYKKTVFEKIILINNKIIVFASFYDSKTDTKKLFATHISPAGVIDTNLCVVSAFDKLASKNAISYDVTFSEKNNSILIFSSFKDTYKEKERFHYKVIDDNFIMKNQAFIELAHSGNITRIVDYTIDNAGNIHLVYKVDLQREVVDNESNDDTIHFNYYIHSYYPATKEFKEYDMRVRDYIITGISVLIDKDSRYMYVPGFYSDKRASALRGTFISKIDILNKQVVYSKEKDFDLEFIAEVYAKPIDEFDKTKDEEQDEKKKGKEQLYDYDIVDLFVNDKEEIVLVSEQYYMRVVIKGTSILVGLMGGDVYETNYYYYNNVMVTKFDATGDRLWCSNIPKFQKTADDGGLFSPIGVFTHNDVVYVIYNDNPKNGTGIASKQYRTNNPKNSQLTMVSVASDGMLKKKVLIHAPIYGEELRTQPKFCSQISDTQVVLIGCLSFNFGYLTYNYKLGKIDLK